MRISSVQKNQNPNFQGRLKSGYLPKMLEHFSEKELAEYKTLIVKAERVPDGRLFGIVSHHKIDLTQKKDYSESYQFVELHPETENTLAPLSRCIKQVLSEKVFFIKKGYNEQNFPIAAVEVILEPLRKLYGQE